uniref:Uncharacterized protein n=1 Tax=Rhizophora mucronata TaxID=61149 RepID=A0A2P2NH43_RHIMU
MALLVQFRVICQRVGPLVLSLATLAH